VSYSIFSLFSIRFCHVENVTHIFQQPANILALNDENENPALSGFVRKKKVAEWACKPGFVESGHFSRPAIARRL